jgi:hypothetical protein
VERPDDSPKHGATGQLFGTSWESVENKTPVFTLVLASQLEGWNLVTAEVGKGGGQQVFEIWSSGDKMPDGQGKPTVVYAAPGNGSNWLSLNDGNGRGHQTLGIERSIATQAGATYTLAFDYAGQIGYGSDYTRIGIYVDGVKRWSYANTGPSNALAWQALQFQFAGTGTAQTIRIAIEGVTTVANGRGAMIDDIALTEQWPLNTGYANAPIRLSGISASLTDTDGSEALTLAIQALPVGSILSDGTRSFTATAGNTAATVTHWTLDNLSLLPPANYTGAFTLSVVATSTETATGAAASTVASLTVTVKHAVGTYQSPLVLDLNNDGVRTTALGETAGRFDLFNTGAGVRSGWISAEDAFLTVDRNHNGRIDNRSELFGGAIGEGFAQLARFDSNQDGVVNSKDLRFDQLRVWQDRNSNHQTDAGELRSLSATGITGINVAYRILPMMQNGNLILERSSATWADGRTTDLVDVYFRVERSDAELVPASDTGAAATPRLVRNVVAAPVRYGPPENLIVLKPVRMGDLETLPEHRRIDREQIQSGAGQSMEAGATVSAASDDRLRSLDRSATIIVPSLAAKAGIQTQAAGSEAFSPRDSNPTLAATENATARKTLIDWDAIAPAADNRPHTLAVQNPNWLTGFLGVKSASERDLASVTGLKITLNGKGVPRPAGTTEQ